MATLEQVETALKNAQAAGNAEAVAKLQAIYDKKIGNPAWSDVGAAALRNAPQSAMQLASDVVQPVLHPIDTANSMLNLAAGGISRGIEAVAGDQAWLPENEATATADAVGGFYKDRYGSMPGFKKALANDPIGVASDILGLISGGAGLATKAPGAIGTAARVANKPVKRAAKAIGRNWVETKSGLGPMPIDEAIRSGERGGRAQQVFTENLRGRGDPTKVVEDARRGTKNMKQAMSRDYEIAEKQILRGNRQPFDYEPSRKALDDAVESLTFEGQWTGGPGAQKAANRLINELYDWRAVPGNRNPEGANALRKKLRRNMVTPGPGVSGDTLDVNRLNTAIVDKLGKDLEATVPGYADMNRNYATQKNELKQIQQALSLGDKASDDTAFRKLLSVARDDVSSNFGQRGRMAQVLENAGARDLLPAIAGQTMKTWTPRGIARTLGGGGAGGGLMGAMASILAGGGMSAAAIPAIVAAVPGALLGTAAASPRIIGETALKLGQFKRKTKTGAGKVLKETAKGANKARKAATVTTVRAQDEEPYMVDAKGNEYDRNGRLIRR